MLQSLSTFEYMVKYIVNADQCSEYYEEHCRTAWNCMNLGQREILKQLVETGPVWDGDIASKQNRDDLFAFGLASRACVKGEQGFTVANYRGWDVYKAGTSL
jgi:hypothetical protein